MGRSVDDVWASGAAYEPYVGRWSRLLAREFVTWLDPAPGGRWLDVGCGTGALTGTILSVARPARVVGVDPSPAFIAYARRQVADPRAAFVVGDARALPLRSDLFDGIGTGLVLNFVADPAAALSEFARVTRPGGIVGAYVWDYAEGMEMMRIFWDAVAALDPAARSLDEGRRFAAVCHPDAVRTLFTRAGLRAVETRAITVPTRFRDFDDYWRPFLGGQGPAPSYVATLDQGRQAALRERLRTMLPGAPDGSILLTARAWAVRGTRGG